LLKFSKKLVTVFKRSLDDNNFSRREYSKLVFKAEYSTRQARIVANLPMTSLDYSRLDVYTVRLSFRDFMFF
jgi:hypothetical protein